MGVVSEPEERIAELTKQGAVERQDLASTVRASTESARETARRVVPVVKVAAAGAAATGAGLLVARIVKRIRARHRQPRAWTKMRHSFREIRKDVEKRRPRPLPITLLFALARSKTVRRAIASAAVRVSQRRSDAAEELPPERPNGPVRAFAPADADREPLEDIKDQEPDTSDIPPPPVPRQKAKDAPLPQKFGIGVALFKAAYGSFSQDEGFSRAAALSYYTVFSLAPLLVIAVAVAGFVFGREAAQGRLIHEIQGMVGPDAARTLQTLMQKAQKPSANVLAAIFGIATLLFGAAGVFGNLQESLNRIWDVPENPHGGFWKMIQSRFLSLAMVLGTGFLLLVSLVISAALSALGDFLRRDLSGAVGFVMNGVNAIVSWAIVGAVFALIFKYLPDTRVAWKDVWIGAAMTSLLFALGQFGIGLYIGKTSVSSVYGGAASLAIVLIWTYYSAAIFYFGAEVTRIYAGWYGTKRKR